MKNQADDQYLRVSVNVKFNSSRFRLKQFFPEYGIKFPNLNAQIPNNEKMGQIIDFDILFYIHIKFVKLRDLFSFQNEIILG
jgi:hypothetical protein